MLIGFGRRQEPNGSGSGIEDKLKQLGCERIYLISQYDDLDEEVSKVLELLRQGDVLVVLQLEELMTNLGGLLNLLQRLKGLQVGLRADAQGIHPGTALGDAFLQSASILATLAQVSEEIGSRAQGTKRSRGRPAALTKSDQAKAAKLINEQNMSVPQVAHLLRVSPATIYRYLPRNRKH